jgi:predicted dehydrogenase
LETGDKQEDRSVIEHIPTHVAGFLEFADGSNGTIVTSFEQGGRSHSRVEIYGTEGAIRLPDPISFDINVKLRQIGEQDWKPVQIHPGPLPQFRGLGLADMAAAIRENRPHNANGEIASHVIDIIWSIHKSAKLCKPLKIKSTYIVQGG